MTKPPKKKDVNTFKGYQDEKQHRREKLIDDYLRALKNSRASFKYVTDLAAHVAAHIGREEKGKCDRATLLRNNRYKAFLLSYMASTIGGGTTSLKAVDLVDPEAKALLTEHELTISNLRRELDRLNAYCEKLEAKLDAKKPDTVGLVQQGTAPDDGIAEADYKYQFVKTCQALRLVLDYLPSQFVIDANNGVLKDATMKRGNNIVVQSDNLHSFVKWLEKTSI